MSGSAQTHTPMQMYPAMHTHALAPAHTHAYSLLYKHSLLHTYKHALSLCAYLPTSRAPAPRCMRWPRPSTSTPAWACWCSPTTTSTTQQPRHWQRSSRWERIVSSRHILYVMFGVCSVIHACMVLLQAVWVVRYLVVYVHGVMHSLMFCAWCDVDVFKHRSLSTVLVVPAS